MSEITKEIIEQAIAESGHFIAGANLCYEGIPCPDNAHPSIVRGYAQQYAIEQQEDAKNGF